MYMSTILHYCTSDLNRTPSNLLYFFMGSENSVSKCIHLGYQEFYFKKTQKTFAFHFTEMVRVLVTILLGGKLQEGSETSARPKSSTGLP